ncbi:MAG: ABC transporter ATP-binding protein, partial [Halieaceae bacterium]
REHGLTMLFVSHDMAVIRQIADRVMVMYQGKLVEQGTAQAVFENPQQAYTQALLASIPGAATASAT